MRGLVGSGNSKVVAHYLADVCFRAAVVYNPPESSRRLEARATFAKDVEEKIASTSKRESNAKELIHVTYKRNEQKNNRTYKKRKAEYQSSVVKIQRAKGTARNKVPRNPKRRWKTADR
ncbi:hypothetical protein K0M31_010049 [Melipona bicolor]|uniref:Uncharacterized protein n=1 Tax=Melipona bicolor TaxID=60889 RepID=A0AA40KIU2_9HYME|nr:hypothetical protein K0M31_010049 [Melipona bicolor]